jgi:hypothetical protein
LWYNSDNLPYAFSAPVSVFETNDVAQVTSNYSPVEVLSFEPEYNALRAANPTDAPIAVVAQTIAYPGWQARVNGQPAQLESVGQLLGVILPPNTPETIIEFIYYPIVFEIGGLITVATTVILILYLLQVDVRFRRWRARGHAPTAPVVVAASVAMTALPAPPAIEPLALPAPTPPAPTWVRPALGALATAVAATAVAVSAFVAGWLFSRRRPPAD